MEVILISLLICLCVLAAKQVKKWEWTVPPAVQKKIHIWLNRFRGKTVTVQVSFTCANMAQLEYCLKNLEKELLDIENLREARLEICVRLPQEWSKEGGEDWLLGILERRFPGLGFVVQT